MLLEVAAHSEPVASTGLQRGRQVVWIDDVAFGDEDGLPLDAVLEVPDVCPPSDSS